MYASKHINIIKNQIKYLGVYSDKNVHKGPCNTQENLEMCLLSSSQLWLSFLLVRPWDTAGTGIHTAVGSKMIILISVTLY